jgi:hypothetical protein
LWIAEALRSGVAAAFAGRDAIANVFAAAEGV